LIIAKNKHGKRTFFADHWPNRAHYWLPVVDHPLEKSTCEFLITAPKKYAVIANGDRINEEDIGGGMKVTHWKEEQPISAKVMVIGVAQFINRNIDLTGFSKAWIYNDTGEAGFDDFNNAQDIYNLFLDQMGEYPFSKLDHVESTTMYGGMENAGNIFYDERIITGKNKIDGLIAHEIGHQWFGNAVTEASWNDIWLSEGFAEFFKYYFIERKYGNDSLQKMLFYDEAKIVKYETRFPDKAVRIKNVEDPKKILSPLVYEKSAWILRMLCHRIGKEAFWQLLREFYNKYKYRNASSEDFIQLAESVSNQNLKAFFNQWLDVPGRPRITYSIKEKGRHLAVSFLQDTEQVYDLSLTIALTKPKNDVKNVRVNINQRSQIVTLEKARGAEVEVDPYNIIYGDIVLR
jgi:aminopeptidase N